MADSGQTLTFYFESLLFFFFFNFVPDKQSWDLWTCLSKPDAYLRRRSNLSAATSTRPQCALPPVASKPLFPARGNEGLVVLFFSFFFFSATTKPASLELWRCWLALLPRPLVQTFNEYSRLGKHLWNQLERHWRHDILCQCAADCAMYSSAAHRRRTVGVQRQRSAQQTSLSGRQPSVKLTFQLRFWTKIISTKHRKNNLPK